MNARLPWRTAFLCALSACRAQPTDAPAVGTAALASQPTAQRTAELEVAIEIDGNWHRQDLDYELAAQALEAGCVFALDSDAHSVGELRFSQYAVAHARLARIPSARVINCWSNEQLEDWMARCQHRVRTALA